MQVDVIPVFGTSGVTATTTSSKFWVGNYKRVALLFRRENDAGGTSAFTVKGGFGDGPAASPTMTALNTLIDNVTNTNGQMPTRVNGKSIAASNGDAMVWLDSETPVTHIEITVTETADGTHKAYIIGFTE